VQLQRRLKPACSERSNALTGS